MIYVDIHTLCSMPFACIFPCCDNDALFGTYEIVFNC